MIELATATLRARFEAKFSRGRPDECWPWEGSIGSHGYGQIALRHALPALAHRVAYELYIGPIPAGLHVDHVAERGCTVKHCVNPGHLEAITQQENNRRQAAAGRRDTESWRGIAAAHQAARTHCKHGHRFDAENTGRTVQGHRYCRACRRERSRDARTRRAA